MKTSASRKFAGHQEALSISGETFLLAEDTASELEAKIAAHDYRHEGWYARVMRTGEHVWSVYVRYGLTRRPVCCRVKKMSYVPGERKEVRGPIPPAGDRLSFARRMKAIRGAMGRTA